QLRREGLGLTRLSVLPAEETAVATWEHDRARAELLGDGMRRAACELAFGLRAHGDDDARRGRLQRGEVGLVVRAAAHVLPEEHVVALPIVLGRQPEGGRIRSGLTGVLRGDRTLLHDERDELRHARAEATLLVRIA